MAMAHKRSSNSDDDFLKVGPDATATFDNSSSNPTEYASSENIDAVDDVEDDDEVDEDIDEDEEDDEAEEYEDEDDEEDDEDDAEDDDEEEEGDEEDHDLATGPKAPSVYRKV